MGTPPRSVGRLLERQQWHQLIEHGKIVCAMRFREDAVGGVHKSSGERQFRNLATQRLLANGSEWRHFLSRPLQRVRERIGDLATTSLR
jgi:hypothetical protein